MLPDFDRQATGKPDGIRRSDAIWTDRGLLNCQELGLPSPNEPAAVVAVLRLLGGEGGVGISGGRESLRATIAPSAD